MKSSYELQAGFFILVGLLLLAFSIFALGSKREIFGDFEPLVTRFEDVRGLQEGAPVRLGGITIGRVKEISFPPEMHGAEVQVGLEVRTEYLSRIPRDATTQIETQGLLGDRFLVIAPGTSDIAVQPGAALKSHAAGDISEVLNQAGEIAQNVKEISEEVGSALKVFREESLSELNKTLTNLSTISEEVVEGEGMLHRLVFSEKDGDRILSGLEETSVALSDISTEIAEGDGLLNALIYEKGGDKTVQSFRKAADSLAETSDRISQIAEEIQSGDGLFHSIIYEESPTGVDELLKKLIEAADDLQKATEALASGSGTLGALLIDSAIYDNLVEVTDSAKRSFVLRSAIRSALEETKKE